MKKPTPRQVIAVLQGPQAMGKGDLFAVRPGHTSRRPVAAAIWDPEPLADAVDTGLS